MTPTQPTEVGDVDDLATIAREQRQDAANARVAQPTLGDDVEVVEKPASVPAVRDQADLPAPLRDAAHLVAALMPADDEWAGVGDGDLAPSSNRRIPYLKLDRNVGRGFYLDGSETPTDELEFIWLAKGQSRGWYEKDWSSSESGPPDCRSADGIHADPQSPNLQNDGDCTTCPLASFNDDDRGGAKRCRQSVEALLFVADEMGAGRLARLRWSGIAVRPALDYWDSFSLRMPKRPPLAYLSKATLVPTDTDFGQKLAPVFVRVNEISRAEAQPLIDERDQRLADWKADVLADAREGVDHTDGPAASSSDGTYPDEEPF